MDIGVNNFQLLTIIYKAINIHVKIQIHIAYDLFKENIYFFIG